MSELTPELVASIRRACRFAELFADAMADLEKRLPPPSQGGGRPGRPAVVPTDEQMLEVLRLRHANGRLGMRTIGRLTGLSWHVVQKILDENAASENPPVSSENSSRGGARRAGSKASRKGGETT